MRETWVTVRLTAEAVACCRTLAAWKTSYKRAAAYGATEDDRYPANYQGLVAEYGFRQAYGMPLQSVAEHQQANLSDPDVGDHVEVRSAYIPPPIGAMYVYPGKDDDPVHRARDYCLVWTPERGREHVAVLIGWNLMQALVPHYRPFTRRVREGPAQLVYAEHLLPPAALTVRWRGRQYRLPSQAWDEDHECPHCGTVTCEHTR